MVAKLEPLPHSLMLTSDTLSVALAPMPMPAPVQSPFFGVVIVTLGGVLSPPPVGGGEVVDTLTEIAVVAVRPAPSVTARFRVWLPPLTPDVFQLNVAVDPLTVWVESVAPLSSFSTKVFGEPCALVAAMFTVTVPLTVAPLAGLVMAAPRAGAGAGVPPPAEAPDAMMGVLASL